MSKSKIINGHILADKIKDKIVKDVEKYCQATKTNGQRPNLAIILVGEREDSKLYVKMKEKEAKKVGIDTHLYKFDAQASEKDLIETIKFLNNDPLIDAILVQLPLPDGLNTDKIINTIDPEKDADRFHRENLKFLFSTCEHGKIFPPVFGVILEILKDIKCNLAGKKICIITNSKIFGKSLARVLECLHAKVDVVYSQDKNIKNKSSQADILITAVGKPKFIKKSMVKDDSIIIDVGISQVKGKVCGDVDFEKVKDKVAFITPVPGGVGPITIAVLFKNVMEIYKTRLRQASAVKELKYKNQNN